MKKLLFLSLVLISINSYSQRVDSVKNAIQVQPIQINALTKDSVFQVSWMVFGISRNDTTQGANSYVTLYDRKGKRVQEMNVPIPAKVLQVWIDDIIIDNHILNFLGLIKRKN